ncbi:AraC family transcriptional regulator [Rhodospirillaceae bacterium KN72]|uniref:AraC family transcriptional regulator n=1 Tax=Pacificispira spongiicola TaxID=2729598 RepID=A0A7Y0DXW1_9PROT|nr:AraC family transcriptional regulator [Pacificispira spongiicola]NMM43622.1 AraC family transcriptional regulator [Pacificispira spongiicola]
MEWASHPSAIVAPSTILASAATGVVELIERFSGDADSILGNVSIRPDDLTNPFNELRLSDFCNLFEEAARQTRNDRFGLHFGEKFEPRRLGAIGYAAISSPTLAAALRNVEIYFPAHQGQSSFGMIREDSDVFWLSYRIFDDRITNRRQDAELSMGMFLNIFREALGPSWVPLEVRFEHDAPDSAYFHEKIFGAPVQFGRRTNAFAFRRRDLDAKMPNQDPYLFSIIEPFLKTRCEIHQNPEDFATTVRNQIKLQLGDIPPSIAEIARILGVTDLSLQRQLRQHGVTFQELVNAARKELALHYLEDPDMRLTEIAHCLGYSELSAFSRAFRGWTGMSPHRYRRM